MPFLKKNHAAALCVIATLASSSCDRPTDSIPPPPDPPVRPSAPGHGPETAVPSGDNAEDLIHWLLADDRNTDSVPFATVVRATAGKQIFPIDREDPITAEILAALRSTMDDTLKKLNAPDSPVRGLSRINEASRYFEDEMLALLDATPGFTCGIPELADGSSQRSGYPDLRLVHTASGRVTYIDPKLFETKGIASTLRTFYFEPKNRTNKILDDAHHILVGIEHDGNDGKWQFVAWHAVDLAKFHVRLKAEFQASNKDLYTPEQTVMVERTGRPGVMRGPLNRPP